MGLKETIREIEYDYTLDETELGKTMIVASATLLMFSLHTVLVIQPAIEEARTTEENLNQLDQVVNSQQFNQSLTAMQDLQTTAVGDDIDYALQTFRGMQVTVQGQEEIYQNLEATNTRYQWLILVGILGIIAGVSIIYV